jgi:hypothetical protein
MIRKAVVTFAAAVTAALTLSGCVESTMPLMTDTHPLLGPQFEVRLYESFRNAGVNDFFTSVYSWKDGQYVRANRPTRGPERFVVQYLASNDFLIQSTDERARVYNYWIGRKFADGAYVIFPLNEADADDDTRNVVCGSEQPEGICRIRTYKQLVTLAHATAAQPVREAALGIVLTK